MRQKKVVIVGGIFLSVVIIGMTGLFINKKVMSHNIFSKPLINSVGFTLFYPTHLPQNYKLNKQSVESTSGQVVTYYATNPSNQHINFSIQAKPDTFDFDNFYTKSLAGTFRFSTENGEGAIGKSEGKTIGSFVSGNSWTLITSENNIDTGTLQSVIKSLAKAP